MTVRMLLTWTYNPGYSEADQARTLALFGKWEPPIPIENWSAFVDGSGGFAVIESDDADMLMGLVATWTPWMSIGLKPIVPIERLAEAQAEAAAFRSSVT
jgi:hypothetical protein